MLAILSESHQEHVYKKMVALPQSMDDAKAQKDTRTRKQAARSSSPSPKGNIIEGHAAVGWGGVWPGGIATTGTMITKSSSSSSH